MEESVHLIEKHLPEEFEEFNKLDIIKDGIYKRTEFAIENIIDICAIINSDLELGIPGSEEDIIDNLQENKILTTENAKRIRKMKGFRNFIVHRYGSLDDKVAFENIHDGMHDYFKITVSIWDFVAASQDD
ncbi:MAG: DUF86 domain-containing protein [ANME-2 cluster archaeon]|nr:DUF86 domain-containing protein [ANME-2 cluster archaeon]